MNNQEALDTLNDIRKMMEKSSRFVSLNGASAIVIGLYSCLAAIIAYYILGGISPLSETSSIPILQINTPGRLRILLIFAAILIGICLLTVILMCRHKALKNNSPFGLDRNSQKITMELFSAIELRAVSFVWPMLYQQHYGLTSSIMLIFYGIALINASNYTYSNTRYLGYTELALGLADSFIEGYALLFWTVGFGIFHIIYGIWFHFKFEKQAASVA